MDEKKHCRDCNCWKPKYHGVGVCTAEGLPNAKLFVANPQSELLTVASFSCQAFTEKKDLQGEFFKGQTMVEYFER